MKQCPDDTWYASLQNLISCFFFFQIVQSQWSTSIMSTGRVREGHMLNQNPCKIMREPSQQPHTEMQKNQDNVFYKVLTMTAIIIMNLQQKSQTLASNFLHAGCTTVHKKPWRHWKGWTHLNTRWHQNPAGTIALLQLNFPLFHGQMMALVLVSPQPAK